MELPGAMTANMPTMPADMSPKTWREFTHESEDAFGRVNADLPPATDRFVKTLPRHFRVKLSDMKKPDAAAADYGADINQLPKGDED